MPNNMCANACPSQTLKDLTLESMGRSQELNQRVDHILEFLRGPEPTQSVGCNPNEKTVFSELSTLENSNRMLEVLDSKIGAIINLMGI